MRVTSLLNFLTKSDGESRLDEILDSLVCLDDILINYAGTLVCLPKLEFVDAICTILGDPDCVIYKHWPS